MPCHYRYRGLWAKQWVPQRASRSGMECTWLFSHHTTPGLSRTSPRCSLTLLSLSQAKALQDHPRSRQPAPSSLSCEALTASALVCVQLPSSLPGRGQCPAGPLTAGSPQALLAAAWPQTSRGQLLPPRLAPPPSEMQGHCCLSITCHPGIHPGVATAAWMAGMLLTSLPRAAGGLSEPASWPWETHLLGSIPAGLHEAHLHNSRSAPGQLWPPPRRYRHLIPSLGLP